MSLTTRIAIGVCIFAALALWDWRKNRERATRWREYLVLFVCVAAALCYGVVNDQITTSISPEYFAFFKGVAAELPPDEPHNSIRFRWEVAKIGMQAAWTPGLIIGVAVLVANNPWKTLPRLPYAQLVRLLPHLLLITAVTAVALGVAGYCGAFTLFHEEFRGMLRDNEFRPRRL